MCAHCHDADYEGNEGAVHFDTINLTTLTSLSGGLLCCDADVLGDLSGWAEFDQYVCGCAAHHSTDGAGCVACVGSGSGEIVDESASFCRCEKYRKRYPSTCNVTALSESMRLWFWINTLVEKHASERVCLRVSMRVYLQCTGPGMQWDDDTVRQETQPISTKTLTVKSHHDHISVSVEHTASKCRDCVCCRCRIIWPQFKREMVLKTRPKNR
jgi:hypothetical protein